jgi:hypothetical protein
MITINNDTLVITIPDSEPKDRHQWLIRAIAAAMRWEAQSPDKYVDDGHNKIVLAQLLEELTT